MVAAVEALIMMIRATAILAVGMVERIPEMVILGVGMVELMTVVIRETTLLAREDQMMEMTRRLPVLQR
ncbi:hypothetical protein Ef18B233LT_38240 [Escherichia fergusonii]|nr:hypothetical protein Ef30038_04500 [Escherichia fergusonii]BES11752.1 hypothetical protein Ef18B226LT_03310 [Escherichia fergusonii]BES19994.1 hypothetical protein Ef18B233LT_38240 [Escherichia fergusonii]BES24535.1 hypothetical protein Ef18B269LT_38790 [Escherichia fergusonii]BES29103.1 hypothetical protein Ef22C021LT_38830 [Escherichia fergusonii]